MVNESLSAELERYKERVLIFEQRQTVDLNKREKLIDSQMDDLIRNKNAMFSKQNLKKNNLNPEVLEGQAAQIVIPNNDAFQNEDLNTYDSNCDDISNAKAVLMANISNYGSEVISEVPHFETYLNDMEYQIKIEAPEELPKVSLVNEILKNIKLHLVNFDKVVKIRTTPNAQTEEYFENNDLKAQLQDKDTTICKLKNIIKSMREKSKEENVNYDYCEIDIKNVELENSVAKLLLENKRLCKEINHVKQVFKDQFDSIKKTRVQTQEQSDSLIDKLNLKYAENKDLKAQIQYKVFVITTLKNNLQKLKEKEIVDIDAQKPSANTIVPGMFKLDLDPLAPKLLQNREAHIDYLKYTQEQADILQGIFEQAKAKQPLYNALDFACRTFTIVGNSCPLTRITSANVVPPKKITSHSVETKKQSLNSTVRFRNNHIAMIIGYGDYQLGNVTNSRILREFYENVGISHQTSVSRTPQQNDIVESSKSFTGCRVKSVGSTAPLEKYCEIRKLDTMSYHAREICEMDHHENVVFLVILQNLKKWLENVLVLVLMEYLLMEHPCQWKLTHENQLKPQLSKQQLLELEKQQLMED
nr:hypothetical protein [Tanacetum cinerariifolium]